MSCTALSDEISKQMPLLNKCNLPAHSWSELRQQYVKPYLIADLHLKDPEIPTSNIDIIFSPEQGKAEIFSINPFQHMLLDAVKGGYMARNKTLFLIKTQSGWEIKKRSTLKNTK